MNKKGIALAQTVFLILGIVGLIIVLYIFIGKGLAGPAKAQTFGTTCAISAQTRGIFVKSVDPLLETIATVFYALYQAAGTIAGYAIGILTAPVGGWAFGPAIGVAMGTEYGIEEGDAFLLNIMSNMPLICPPSLEKFGEEDNRMIPELFAEKAGSRILQVFDAFGSGSYDPLYALRPNPRTLFIIDMQLTEETDFKEIYDEMIKLYGQKAPKFFDLDFEGDDEANDPRVYVYCETNRDPENPYERLGNSPNSFSACKMQDSRMYVMFKDDYFRDIYTIGTSLCDGLILTDAKRYAEEFSVIIKTESLIWDREEIFRDDITDGTTNPWRHERDDIVLCIEHLG